MNAPAMPKRPRGRPAAEPGQGKDELIKIRATAEEKARFAAVGGPTWFRAALKRAKPRP
ncbi:MAG: hypothetical protein KF863_21330 [Rubrivivax sp.]|nr:hypothetical protein [Rubrivivax sp.]